MVMVSKRKYIENIYWNTLGLGWNLSLSHSLRLHLILCIFYTVYSSVYSNDMWIWIFYLKPFGCVDYMHSEMENRKGLKANKKK